MRRSCWTGLLGTLGAVAVVLLVGAATLAGPITIDGGWHYAEWYGAGQVWTDGPYTFTAATPVILEVRDDFMVGDQFRVYDDGSLLGDTSAPGPGYSTGEWTLLAGAHSITILVIMNPYDYGGFYLQVTTSPDSTPPTILGCPGDIEVDAAPGAADAQVWWTAPTATDAESGVASFTSTHVPGDRFPLGITLVTYVATDGVGNVSTCSFLVIVHQTLDIVPPLGSVLFLGRGWEEAAGGGGGLDEPPIVGELPVSTVYVIGEPIAGCCSVVDWIGRGVEADSITLTLYDVTVGDGFDTREPLEARTLLCGEDLCFCFSLDTTGLAPGYYDIRLGLPFMDHEWIRVELVAP